MFLVEYWNGETDRDKQVNALFVTSDEEMADGFVKEANTRQDFIYTELDTIYKIYGGEAWHVKLLYYDKKYYRDPFGVAMSSGGLFSYYPIKEYKTMSEIYGTKVI